jgi:ribosome-associated translation inhibitor RaiA
MARILDVNEKFAGQEPKFSGEVSERDLGVALSWYSTNRKAKDSQKYASAYFKKVYKLDILPVIKSKPTQFGFVCRILTNGGVLSPERKEWFDNLVEELKQELVKVKSKVKTEEFIEVIKVNIQDRIREKSVECIGELEGQMDELIESKFSKNPSPYSTFHTMNIKSVHVRNILEWAKQKRSEFDEVITTDDKELKEGYSNFTKNELKKIIGYYDQVILDCNKVNSSVTRKPRKRKVKTPEELVAKMKYLGNYEELGLTSIQSKDIIGSMQLWVYNTKNKKLGVYNAEDAGGLSVKGSAIVNFSETKSIQKTLRKPKDILPKLLSGGKVALRNILGDIRAVESSLTGRINSDTILLRIVK